MICFYLDRLWICLICLYYTTPVLYQIQLKIKRDVSRKGSGLELTKINRFSVLLKSSKLSISVSQRMGYYHNKTWGGFLKKLSYLVRQNYF